MEQYVFRQRQSWNAESLSCMCGISTYVLFVTFKKMGYKPMFCMNDDHCFLRMGDYWIDLTLTQFDTKFPKVYCQKNPHGPYGNHDTNMHRISKKARTITKLQRMFRAWPKDQNPFKLKGLPIISVSN